MTAPLFADAFYFIAYLNPDDPAHQKVMQLTLKLKRHLVTTEWVLMEVADALCDRKNRAHVARFLRELPSNRLVTIIPAARDLYEEGLFLYSRRQDKD